VDAGSFTYNETVTIAKTLTLSGGPTVQNLEIASSAVVTLGANLSISGTLTLTSGSILTGSNKVIIISNTAGAVAATNGTINGTIERPIAALAAGTYVFTEANTSLTPNVGQGAITVSFSAHPNTTPPNVSTGVPVLRYYSITPIGALTATLRLAYLESELNTISESNLSMFRWNNVAWVVIGGLPNTGSNYIELAGISEFSDWALGDITRPLPIQLASFTWTALAGSGIRLEWATLSEINNYGFYVQKRPKGETAFADIPGSFVAGGGTTAQPHSYSYVDAGFMGGVWEYRLKQVDLDNSVHFSDFLVVDAVNAVVEETPKEFALLQNYPNPFNPKTVVSYQLPAAGDVRLAVYDLLGREVATLVNEWRPAGKYNVAFDASGLSSGVYLYKLESNGKSATRKLTLVR
jgi:hypothetical protein